MAAGRGCERSLSGDRSRGGAILPASVQGCRALRATCGGARNMENGRFHRAPLAQRLRASDYGSEGRGFKSLRERHLLDSPTLLALQTYLKYGIKYLANFSTDLIDFLRGI